MDVTLYANAPEYAAKAHFGMVGYQLQGGAASWAESAIVSVSHFLPGGGAEMTSSPAERFYIVLEGEIAVTTTSGTVRLGRLDSCYLERGEERSIVNPTKAPATMLVVVIP